MSFKYVDNSLREKSFLSALSLSCKGCMFFACWWRHSRGWTSEGVTGALGLTREQSLTVTAACRSHCGEATPPRPSCYQCFLRPRSIHTSHSHSPNGGCGKEAAGAGRSLRYGAMAPLRNVLPSNQKGREERCGGWRGAGLVGGMSLDVFSLAGTLMHFVAFLTVHFQGQPTGRRRPRRQNERGEKVESVDGSLNTVGARSPSTVQQCCQGGWAV